MINLPAMTGLLLLAMPVQSYKIEIKSLSLDPPGLDAGDVSHFICICTYGIQQHPSNLL